MSNNDKLAALHKKAKELRAIAEETQQAELLAEADRARRLAQGDLPIWIRAIELQMKVKPEAFFDGTPKFSINAYQQYNGSAEMSSYKAGLFKGSRTYYTHLPGLSVAFKDLRGMSYYVEELERLLGAGFSVRYFGGDCEPQITGFLQGSTGEKTYIYEPSSSSDARRYVYVGW